MVYKVVIANILVTLCGYLSATAAEDPGLKFIENKNQWPRSIYFSARIPSGNMNVEPGMFSYFLLDGYKLDEIHDRSHEHKNESDGLVPLDEMVNGHLVQAVFRGANQGVIPQPFGKHSTYYNYFGGNDPGNWASSAYSYDGFILPSFYEGVDMKVYSVGENLKYDFVVAPSADPSRILIEYKGADDITINDEDLVVKTSVGSIIEKKPYAYQLIQGKRKSVSCEFLLQGNLVSFFFPDGYDRCYELIIDPLLIFSTYSGSKADNWGSTATPGEHGSLYSSGVANHFLPTGTGQVFSGAFPATAGAFQTSYGGLYDVALLKYDSLGKKMLYASYLGGSGSESPHSLVMNNEHELIILGTTSSDNFPTTEGVFNNTFSGGAEVRHVVTYTNGSDIFVAKVSSDGATLLASTYLGGEKNDGLNPSNGVLTANYGDELRGDIITDVSGNIYISSVTASEDFPVKHGFDTTYNGGVTDALLLKLSPDLKQMIWGTYLGGNGTDASHSLKLDEAGNIFLAGGTDSGNFPVTPSSYDPTTNGKADGWIAKIAGDGKVILQSTYTGTGEYDQVYFIDLNVLGEIFVYGQTASPDFIITPGVYNKKNSGQFVQKFSNDLSVLIFSTVFGSGRGIPDISPTAFSINECNNLYMAGWGGTTNASHWFNTTAGLEVSSDAIQKTTSGSDFYFIVLTADATKFLYGTYLGGSFSKTHVDGGTSRFDKSGIVYHVVCSGCLTQQVGSPVRNYSDFPTTPGAWSKTNNSINCNNAAFKLDLSSLKARIQTNSVSFNAPGLTWVCIPDKIIFQNKCIGGKNFEWDLGDGTKFTKTDTSAVLHQYKNPGKYTVKLKAIDPGTCKVTDETSAIVDVYKRLAVVQDDDVICGGSLYTLQASGGISYNWSVKNGDPLANSSSPGISPEDTTTYYVTIIEQSGCITKDTVTINVVPKIEPQFQLEKIGECLLRPIVKVINTTKEADDSQMIFSFGDNATSDLSEVSHPYEKDGTYDVRLIGRREFCVYETNSIIPIYTLKVPNIITPGQPEGKNDVFTVQCGEEEGNTPEDFGLKTSIIIYNRWGKKVFEDKDYQFNWSGDGLLQGIYYYEVEVEGYPVCKSWLHIVK